MERDFKGVWIPKEIWLDIRLNALDKVILTEIDSLDQGKSGCYASNKYIADFCQCSERKVSDAITKLIKLGYIKLTSFDGRLRVLQSCLAKSASLPRKNCVADTQNPRDYTIENNIDNNTDIKNAENPQKRKRFTPPTVEEVSAYCLERKNGIDAQRFVDYYSSNGWKVGKNAMKDWKAAVRTWERNEHGNSTATSQQSEPRRMTVNGKVVDAYGDEYI